MLGSDGVVGWLAYDPTTKTTATAWQTVSKLPSVNFAASALVLRPPRMAPTRPRRQTRARAQAQTRLLLRRYLILAVVVVP